MRRLIDQSDTKLKLVRRTYIVAYLANLSSPAAREAALLCWLLSDKFLTMRTPSKNPKIAVYIYLTRGSAVEYKVKIKLQMYDAQECSWHIIPLHYSGVRFPGFLIEWLFCWIEWTQIQIFESIFELNGKIGYWIIFWIQYSRKKIDIE